MTMTRPHRAPVTLLALLLTIATVTTASAPPAEAQTEPVVVITGGGWGHGRGLGQYGARGYANQGWSAAQILDHFYGGTVAGPAPGDGPVNPSAVRVELREMRGVATAVGLHDGSIVLSSSGGAELARVSGAVRLVRSGSGYWVDTASGCGEGWTSLGYLADQAEIRLTTAGSTSLLHTCGPRYRTWYRGEVRATLDGSLPVTVNVVSIEDYLAGVVPNEMPASWPAAALQAQAVAARSYALAGDTRQQPYADTCDTIRCQVYDGAYTERGGRFRSSTDGRTDAAIGSTAGQVRLWPGGGVARTEFSSSTGGYTTGGAFPAVVDDGDANSDNPNHTWTVTVPTSRIEGIYRKGRLLGIDIVERNGHGAGGGRVVRMELHFEGGTVSETGDQFRSRLGLRSTLFAVGPVDLTGRRGSAAGEYIESMHQLLAGRGATDGEILEWYDAVESGDRQRLTASLVTSEHFVGALIDDLYQTALGRAADADGRIYWIGAVGQGFAVESVGVLFYGSPEYYARSGGTDTAFVTALYRDLLHRTPDSGGQQYWEDRLADGSANLDDVVAGFYSSLESRRDRAVALHLRVKGSAPDAATTDAIAERLAARGTLGAAAELAATP